MDSHLASKMSNFSVANLRNCTLLRAICALNLNILHHPDIGNLLRSDLFKGSLNQTHNARSATSRSQ